MGLFYFERNGSLLHKIFNLQSYSLFLGVSPLDQACPFANLCIFTSTHHIKVASWVGGGGGGGEQGQQCENV